MLNSLLLAISSSIDSLGIGITYGIKNTKISKSGKIILFVISLLTTYISILFGNIIQYIFPNTLTNFLGCFVLVCMGILLLLVVIVVVIAVVSAVAGAEAAIVDDEDSEDE